MEEKKRLARNIVGFKAYYFLGRLKKWNKIPVESFKFNSLRFIILQAYCMGVRAIFFVNYYYYPQTQLTANSRRLDANAINTVNEKGSTWKPCFIVRSTSNHNRLNHNGGRKNEFKSMAETFNECESTFYGRC